MQSVKVIKKYYIYLDRVINFDYNIFMVNR